MKLPRRFHGFEKVAHEDDWIAYEKPLSALGVEVVEVWIQKEGSEWVATGERAPNGGFVEISRGSKSEVVKNAKRWMEANSQGIINL